MNRTLKIFFLMLFVSSVSFVYAQDEVDKETGKDMGSVSDAGKAGKAGAKDINMDVSFSSNELSVLIKETILNAKKAVPKKLEEKIVGSYEDIHEGHFIHKLVFLENGKTESYMNVQGNEHPCKFGTWKVKGAMPYEGKLLYWIQEKETVVLQICSNGDLKAFTWLIAVLIY